MVMLRLDYLINKVIEDVTLASINLDANTLKKKKIKA